MHFNSFILYTLFVFNSCNNNLVFPENFNDSSIPPLSEAAIDTNPYGSINEIPFPAGFARIKREHNSFANWLLNVKLKKDKTVYKFDGAPKANQNAQFAVLDISVGDKDLQQCADAVMRLRAEYLFAAEQYGEIHFTDNAGTVYQFNEPYTIKNLHIYLQRVFGMCGSASLAKQLRGISFKDIEPGDVIIRGGFPGHAVIVMDVAINMEGKKVFLLAQSYMPAQDIHVLVNPRNNDLSPWYLIDENLAIYTPEYLFKTSELKTW